MRPGASGAVAAESSKGTPEPRPRARSPAQRRQTPPVSLKGCAVELPQRGQERAALAPGGEGSEGDITTGYRRAGREISRKKLATSDPSLPQRLEQVEHLGFD